MNENVVLYISRTDSFEWLRLDSQVKSVSTEMLIKSKSDLGTGLGVRQLLFCCIKLKSGGVDTKRIRRGSSEILLTCNYLLRGC